MTSAAQLARLLADGARCRAVAAAAMDTQPSRAHTVVQLKAGPRTSPMLLKSRTESPECMSVTWSAMDLPSRCGDSVRMYTSTLVYYEPRSKLQPKWERV